MPSIPGLEGTFDTAAAAYEKYRPGYPDALYRMILGYCPLDGTSQAAEIGIGTGQATLPFLQTGCSVLAVERGAAMSAICRQKFAAYRSFSVVTDSFETAPLPQETFDLVYSATAFHWIPEQTGYPKVFSVLKHGGAFARFQNHPFPGREHPQLTAALDRLYAAYYDRFYGRQRTAPAEFTEQQAAERAACAARYGFTDIRYALFHRTRTLSAADYCALLGTYSDHIAMPEPLRTEFFGEIGQAILAHGGTLTLHDTIDLQLVRKP